MDIQSDNGTSLKSFVQHVIHEEHLQVARFQSSNGISVICFVKGNSEQENTTYIFLLYNDQGQFGSVELHHGLNEAILQGMAALIDPGKKPEQIKGKVFLGKTLTSLEASLDEALSLKLFIVALVDNKWSFAHYEVVYAVWAKDATQAVEMAIVEEKTEDVDWSNFKTHQITSLYLRSEALFPLRESPRVQHLFTFSNEV